MGVGSIKCGHLDEGVFVVFFLVFFSVGRGDEAVGTGRDDEHR